jgi:hypothetical protein
LPAAFAESIGLERSMLQLCVFVLPRFPGRLKKLGWAEQFVCG